VEIVALWVWEPTAGWSAAVTRRSALEAEAADRRVESDEV
jgi:hypothetical protein